MIRLLGTLFLLIMTVGIIPVVMLTAVLIGQLLGIHW